MTNKQDRRRLVGWVMVMCLLAAQAGAQESVVVAVKKQLVAQQVDLSGACGAFRITNEAAKLTGYGLLKKAGGNRAVPQPDGTCLDSSQTTDPGYATDYLIQPGTWFGIDILGDGGGANVPQWGTPETDAEMVARNKNNFAAPIGASLPPVPLPPPVVVPPASTVDLTPLLHRLDVLEHLQADADRTAAALATRVDAVVAKLKLTDASVAELQAKPVPTSCTAAINLGATRIPISCRLQQ